MSETFAEITLRLAREQLAAEGDRGAGPRIPEHALPPLVGVSDEAAPGEMPSMEGMPPSLTRLGDEAYLHEPGVQVGSADDTATGDHGLGAGQTTSLDPPGPPLQRGGEEDRPADGFGLSDELGIPQPRVAAAQDLVFQSPATTSPDPPDPPLRRGREGFRPATVFESDDVPQAGPQSGTRADDRGVHQVVETIGEHSRRLEDVLSELDRSLTALFTTQLETLRQLRDHAQEQERRWVEQTANRRSAFSAP